jgi:hypothetical protein
LGLRPARSWTRAAQRRFRPENTIFPHFQRGWMGGRDGAGYVARALIATGRICVGMGAGACSNSYRSHHKPGAGHEDKTSAPRRLTPPSRQSTRDPKVVEASRAIKRPYFHARKSGSSPAGHGANHRGTVGVLSTTRGTVQGVEAKSRESGIVLGLGSASCVRILAHFIEAYLGQSVHCRSNGGGPRSGPHVWRRVGLRAQGGLPLNPPLL